MTLLILGHPHYEHSIANKAVIDNLISNVPDLEIRNLSQLYPTYQIDVAVEQQALLRHHNIILQYPLFWYNVTAILKLWLDEVLVYNFAYGAAGYQLAGKNLLLSITVGGEESYYHPLGKNHFRVEEFCKPIEQTAYFIKMNFLTPQYFYENFKGRPDYNVETVQQNAKHQAESIIQLLKNAQETSD